MDEERRKAIEQLETASPLEVTKLLQDIELYDAKSSQEIIDEVYEQFATGENMKDEILKPVFTSVVDGLLEATAGGKAARKKGLTASRILQECEQFSYDNIPDNGTNVNGYTEYKNIKEFDSANSNMSQEFERNRYEDKAAMKKYKESRVKGEKTLVDEYTGKANLYLKRDNPNQHYNDETHRKQAQPDHIVPLKEIHEKLSSNYALDDSDIKRIANIEGNFAVTSAEINQTKLDKTNKEYIKWMEEHGQPLDKKTKENMLKKQKAAEKAIDSETNKTVKNNLLGKGEVNKETMDAAVKKFKEENGGKSPTKEQRQEIEDKLRKDKTKEIRGTAAKNAASQAADYAVGNLILFIVKPMYYELSDTFKNGLQEGVGADSGIEALKIRFGRIKNHVLTHASAFLGDNIWEFVKGFVSSLIEGIVNLFVGVFKQVLKVLKEGIKIFVQSAKILFGKDSQYTSPAEKGDAIIKLIGGSVIAIAGVGIEFMLNKIGITEPWSVILSTMLSGIASALFMYLLNKADLFSVKAEKRHNRIAEIFDERIKEITDAAEMCDIVAVETLRRQRTGFEDINNQINQSIKDNNIDLINRGLEKMAEFLGVSLNYSNTEEFCVYMDSAKAISL